MLNTVVLTYTMQAHYFYSTAEMYKSVYFRLSVSTCFSWRVYTLCVDMDLYVCMCFKKRTHGWSGEKTRKYADYFWELNFHEYPSKTTKTGKKKQTGT